jgi:signal transduction histidine kinase
VAFAWSIIPIFEVMFHFGFLYFIYVFIDGKDIGIKQKMIFFAMLVPIVVFCSTSLNIGEFDLNVCGFKENNIFSKYYTSIEIIINFWAISVLINRYFRAVTIERKKIFFLGFGLLFMTISFLVATVIPVFVLESDSASSYQFEMYGLFGIDIFIAVMAYIIVQYGAMDIKLARAQALVWSLIFLIGAQFFFIHSNTNKVLNSIAFVLVCIIGYGVVKSVKREEMQKDRLMKFSKDLARANAELKRLDNAKSEFISIASHQLRTPLTAIKGYISLILEGAYGENTDKTDDALNKIFLANERLIQLVEDMLNLTRIESGRLEYRLEDDVHVEDILNELKDMFILRAQDKKLELEIQMPDGQLPAIKADKSKLREVISNLMDNAIKYTKEGFVHVIAQKDGNIVRIIIKDSGMGISEESLKTLFAKFSRGTDSTKVYTDGSGLGLYVGKNLIESQGGHIYAKSDGVDKGSEFIIEMPIAKG